MCDAQGCDQPVRTLQRGRVSKYCQTHQHLETRARNKSCKEPGCNKNPHYGVSREVDPKSKAEYCSGHKKDGMINIHGRKCKHRGCMKQPRFDYHQGKGKFCADHRESGMRDVLYKPCAAEGCMKHPHFGLEEGGPRYCAKHRTDNMVDVKHPRCHTRGCPELRMVREDGHRAQRCAFHEAARSRTLRPRGREGMSQNSRVRAKEGRYTLALPPHPHRTSTRQRASATPAIGTSADSMGFFSSVSSSPRVRRGSRKRKAPQWLEGSKVEEGDLKATPAPAPSPMPMPDLHSIDVGSIEKFYETESDHPSDKEDDTGSGSDTASADGDDVLFSSWDQLDQSTSGGASDGGGKRQCRIGMDLDELLEAELSSETDASIEYKDTPPVPTFAPDARHVEADDAWTEEDNEGGHIAAYLDTMDLTANQWSFHQTEGLEDLGTPMPGSSQGPFTPCTEREKKNFNGSLLASLATPGATSNLPTSWGSHVPFPSTFSSCKSRCRPSFVGDLPGGCGLDTNAWPGGHKPGGVSRVKAEEDGFGVASAVTSAARRGKQQRAQHTSVPSNPQNLQGREWGQAQRQWVGQRGVVRELSDMEGVLELPGMALPFPSAVSVSYSTSLMLNTSSQPVGLSMQVPSSGHAGAGFAPPSPPSCYSVASAKPSTQGPAVSVAAAAAVAAASAAWAKPPRECSSLASPLALDSVVFPAGGPESNCDVVGGTDRDGGARKIEGHHGNPFVALPCQSEETGLFDADLMWALKEKGSIVDINNTHGM
ncbi:unnamed protein product [Discosporangium mesarthrocarpum]